MSVMSVRPSNALSLPTCSRREIETTLQALHGENAVAGTCSSSSSSSSSSSRIRGSGDEVIEVVTATSKAFAIVDEILDGSPAATANIHDGDELLQFGLVTSATNDSLNALPAVVRDHVHRPIACVVRRKGELINVVLVPKPWGGRGLLGCHFTPITMM